jgi:hypothetical protein
MHTLVIWIVGLLHALDCGNVLVMEIVTIVLCSYGDAVTSFYLGIEIGDFLRGDVVLRLLPLTCCPLVLILAMPLDAYVLVGPLVLVVW